MPVLHGDMSRRPPWCELEHFTIMDLSAEDEQTWRARHRANKLVTVQGSCHVTSEDDTWVVEHGGSLDVPPGDYVLTCTATAVLVKLGGVWGDDCGGAGVFRVDRAEQLDGIGDPITYPKHTDFDRHYHDCDEYWILVTGRGTAYSEGVQYEVGPGDCVATRMGYHHDFPQVEQPVRAVYFETTMRGQRRRGHLWEHTHGPAKPVQDESE